MAVPCFKFMSSDQQDATEYLDIASWIQELNVVHNDVEADGAGRDPNTGEMLRKRIAEKHTLNVKLNRISATQANQLYMRVEDKSYFFIRYHHPCKNGYYVKKFYCSSVNWGAQRYNRQTGRIFYDGVSFSVIQY